MTKQLFNKNHSYLRFVLGGFMALLCVLMFNASCSIPNTEVMTDPVPEEEEEEEEPKDQKVEGVDYFLPHIDLNNWKVTLPIGNPTEVKPPEILDYAKSELLQTFMYNDSTDGSLVFYTYPGESTAN